MASFRNFGLLATKLLTSPKLLELAVRQSNHSRSILVVAFCASNAIIAGMATLTIRQLDEKTKTRLRIRAAHHGRSMEAEAREILRSALTTPASLKGNLAETIHRRFATFGGIDLPPVRRDAVREISGFEE